MGRYDRSIKIAFDKTSGEILDADEIFDITKVRFRSGKNITKKTSCFLVASVNRI